MSGKPRSNAIPWTAFLLGAGASIAANVAHAAERNAEGTDTGAMLFAAWAPVALLLVAEMMVRGQRPRGLLSAVEWIGAFLVALAAAVVSYGHMRGLLLQYGESELVAVLLPLSVDGLVVVASVALAAGRRNKAEQQRNKPEQPGDEERKAERGTEQQRDEERKTEQSPERKEERDEERNPEQQRNPERDEEQQRNEERKTEQERKAEQQRNPEQRKDEERKTEQRKDEERNVRVPVVEVGSPTAVPVTVTPPHSAERRSAVEWVAEQLRSGATLTGAEIGARYGRTDRWGRNVLRDARQQLAAAVPA